MPDPTAPERHAPSRHCATELPGDVTIHVCAMPARHSAHVLHMCRCGYTWDEESGRVARADAAELPSVDELLGADPDYLGGQSVDDYIREARRDV